MIQHFIEAAKGVHPLAAKRSKTWRIIRKEYLGENPRCASCLSSKKLEVHHIIPFHIQKELELDKGNLMTLCGHCHFVIGHLCNWKQFNFDALNTAKKLSNLKQKWGIENVCSF